MKLFVKKGLIPLVLLLVLLLSSTNLFSLPTPPARRYVTVTGAGLKDGSSWANAYDGLQLKSVMDEPQYGDIWVARGTYYPTADGDQTVSFQMQSDVRVYGGFAGTETSLSERSPMTNVTILSGDIGNPGDNIDNSYHVISNTDVSNTAILDGITISGGNADVTGGGIFNSNSSPVISNCVIINNSTNAGGNGAGIYNEALSSPTFVNCIIVSNSTDGLGGGMYNSESNPTLINCDILKNSAGYGGGIYNDTSSLPVINNSIIWFNTAVSGGNQIYVADGVLTLNYTCYSNNNPGTGVDDVTDIPGSLTATNCICQFCQRFQADRYLPLPGGWSGFL
jgi:hypothetical protein